MWLQEVGCGGGPTVVLELRGVQPSAAAHEGQGSLGGPAGGDLASQTAPQARLPVIEGFFCRKIPDRKQLIRDLEAVKRADAADKDKHLTQLEST